MSEAQAQQAAGESRELVGYSVEGGVALLTLDDPPANTYSYEMMRQLDRRILDARMDESAQVILITGAGEKFFCAGADISMLQSVTPTFKYYFCLHANETLSRLEQTPQLVVAASAEEFRAQALDYAKKFTAPGRAAHAVGRIKRSVQSGLEIPFEYGLALERELQQQLFQSEDAREGLDAYVQKRKPVFKGK